MRKFLNWLNGTSNKGLNKVGNKGKPNQWGRQTIDPLPDGDAKLTKYQVIKTKPLSAKLLEEYRRGRDSVIGDFKKED